MNCQTKCIWPTFTLLTVLAGCGSVLECYATSSGIASTTYVNIDKANIRDVAQSFRQFASREQLNCSRPINAPRDILDSCDGQGGMYITMIEESRRLKFLAQTHPMLMMKNEDKAKASLRELSGRLADDLRSKFGDAVESK